MYYIYDCNNKIVGNPKGYKTMKAAQSALHNRKNKVYWDVESAYQSMPKPPNRVSYVYSRIEWGDDNESK